VARGLRLAAAIPGSALYAIAVITVAWTLLHFYLGMMQLPPWF
jgi:hypothetical protein